MQILIDETKLNLLLEKKKQYIGKTVAIDSIASSLSFLISVLMASYKDILGIQGKVFKTVFVILGIGFTVKSIYDIYKNRKNNYNYEDLMSDINKLNEIAHEHSIVVIKDSFQEYPNRYLVYDEPNWDNCKFFLNYKENENNENFIRGHLSGELKVNPDKIKLQFKGQRIHPKYSVSEGKEKIYSHKFYLATIEEFPEDMKKDTFEKDGRRYYWKSISELEADEKVRKYNSDIVGYVKELF